MDTQSGALKYIVNTTLNNIIKPTGHTPSCDKQYDINMMHNPIHKSLMAAENASKLFQHALFVLFWYLHHRNMITHNLGGQAAVDGTVPAEVDMDHTLLRARLMPWRSGTVAEKESQKCSTY